MTPPPVPEALVLVRPDDPMAMRHRIAWCLKRQGNPRPWLCRLALLIPDPDAALVRLLAGLGEAPLAVILGKRLVAGDPAAASGWHAWFEALRQAGGDLPGAARRWAVVCPDAVAALFQGGREAAAEAGLWRLRAAAALAPDRTDILCKLAAVARRAGRKDLILAPLRRAWTVDPSPDHLARLADGHGICGHHAAAIRLWTAAMVLAPDRPDLVEGRGTLHLLLAATTPAARDLARRCLWDPGDDHLRWQLGKSLTASPGAGAGWWHLYAGFASGDVEGKPDLRGHAPLWTGAPLVGRRLVIWAQQGLADHIRYLTCLDGLIARGETCTVLTDRRLLGLLGRTWPEIRFADADTIPAFDLQAPMLALPATFRRQPSDYPTRIRRLAADPARVAALGRALDALGPGLKVGICWRSVRFKLGNNLRVMSDLNDWDPILTVPGVHFVNLQYDEPEAELAAAQARTGVTIHDPCGVDLWSDLEGVAALVAALDVVVGTGTLNTTLAAAVGTPTLWLMGQPDDWMTQGSDRIPWFPGARPLFRAGRFAPWDQALAQAGLALTALARPGALDPGRHEGMAVSDPIDGYAERKDL